MLEVEPTPEVAETPTKPSPAPHIIILNLYCMTAIDLEYRI